MVPPLLLRDSSSCLLVDADALLFDELLGGARCAAVGADGEGLGSGVEDILRQQDAVVFGELIDDG